MGELGPQQTSKKRAAHWGTPGKYTRYKLPQYVRAAHTVPS